MKKVLLITTVLLLASWVSNAQIDGDELLKNLEKSDLIDRGTATKSDEWDYALAFGYIRGVMDSFLYQKFSPPENSTTLQAMDIVEKYLNKNTENRDILGSVLIIDALSEAWPMKDRPLVTIESKIIKKNTN